MTNEQQKLRFFDTSGLLPWLRYEQNTAAITPLLSEGTPFFVWWGTASECESTLARLEREHAMHAGHQARARGRLKALQTTWHEVQPTAQVKQFATRILRTHPLKATDALQLAAALSLARNFPSDVLFITFDEQLRLVAEKEGFEVWSAATNLA